MVLNLRKNQGMVLYVDNYKSINQLATYFQGGGGGGGGTNKGLHTTVSVLLLLFCSQGKRL